MVRVRKQLMPSGKTLLLEASLLIGRADCPGLALQAQKPLLAKSKPPHGEFPSPAPSRSSSLCWAWQTLAVRRESGQESSGCLGPSTQQHVGGLRSDSTPSLAEGVPSWERGSDWEENRARRKVAAGWLDPELGKRETVLLFSLDR